MPKPSTITIDGFAASGKSTVAERLAQALDYLYFDTGIMYRAVTWAVLDRQLDPNDIEKVSQLSEDIIIDIEAGSSDNEHQATVLVDGKNITRNIRDPEVEAKVSQIAGYPRVRQALTSQQRRIGAAGCVVMAGRDIGTVVLPNADLKIFLQASAEKRAQRRFKEATVNNGPASYKAILEAIIARDKRDRENPVSPTRPAKDAVMVDTDELTVEAVVAHLMQLVVQYKNGK